MRPSTIVIPLLFGFFLFVVLIWLVSQNGTAFLEETTKLAALRHAAGLFLTAAAGLLILIRAAAGEAAGRLLGLVLAALVGVLLIEPSWGLGLGLGAATVGLALRPTLGGWSRRAGERATTVPPV